MEAVLLSMCFVYPEKVRRTKVYNDKKRKTKKKRGVFLEFTLEELIKIAEELKWLPMQEKVENIGIFKDWVKWVQKSRNFVHPARWLKPDPYFGNIHKEMQDFSESKFKRFVEISEKTISVIIDILRHKVELSLAKALDCKHST